MKSICIRIQETLAADGRPALRDDPAAQRHLEECPDCLAFLESFAALEQALDALPVVDVPDAVVDALLARPELDAPSTPRRVWGFQMGWRGILAVAGTAMATLVLLVFVPGWIDGPDSPLMADRLDPALADDDKDRRFDTPADADPPQVTEEQLKQLRALGYVAEPESSDRPALPAPPLREGGEAGAKNEERVRVVVQSEVAELESTYTTTQFSDEFIENLPVDGRFYQNVLTLAPGVEDPDGSGQRDFKAVVGGVSNVGSLTESDARTVGDDMSTDAVAAFWNARTTIDGLSFNSPTGYWANSYVPGDPALRLLQARLRVHDREALAAFASNSPRLHDAARRVAQPFDAPSGAALAVRLSSDHRTVDGERRVLLQVGLQAADRAAGRRPTLNVGLVLDLRGDLPVDSAAAVRALIEAFNEQRVTGDRFSLTVAGKSGATVASGETFRHGVLSVALQRLLEDDGIDDGPTLSLEQAFARAIEQVAANDDPTAPLGSSAVVLVTAAPLGEAADELTALAHASAVAGVPVSAIGVGDEVRIREIDRLVLAGQGNRRLLESPGEASRLVDRELNAVGRAVARVVRLSIRPAPGVRLIDVLGSESLTAVAARHVREAEQSIDRRLGLNLGIEQDRGDDEDGIQIVIPNFHAGDAHTILLDVVVPGPGPVAEVTARYKDLIFLRNGTERASLALAPGESRPGPLERNVLKNFLAWRLASVLERAGDLLASGDATAATAELRAFRDLLAGLRDEVDGLEHDPGLATDVVMLDEYAGLLESGAIARPDLVALLIDSLHFAGRLKVSPPPIGQ